MGNYLAIFALSYWKTTTLVVALRVSGPTALTVVDGPMNGDVFVAYVEQQLAPTLKRGDRSDRQPRQPQACGGADRDRIGRRRVEVSAAVQPGSEPDREGVRQAQGEISGGAIQDDPGLGEGSRRGAGLLLARRMPKLLCELRLSNRYISGRTALKRLLRQVLMYGSLPRVPGTTSDPPRASRHRVGISPGVLSSTSRSLSATLCHH